ncbi:MAG TPA: FCD domain-containing protein [Casimicrobiaceae bacterium]|nr:FCD domain-containing protein [Casimicrobiaceae bacterium]
MSSRPPATYLSKAQQVAQDLLARIDDSDVQPGQSFATEAELLQQFDVSRPTLREGIRILEAQGVLQQRPGPGGGLVVRRPSLDMLAHSLSVYLRFNDVPFVAVLQAREVVEPALAAEAAERATDEDFREMAESIERMKAQGDSDQAVFIAENRVFHGIVARASGNKVLETFWGTMSLLAHGEHHGMRYTFGNRQHVIAAHQRILDACRRRNARAASQAMAEHVGELEHLVRDRYQHLLGQPMSVRDRRGVR